MKMYKVDANSIELNELIPVYYLKVTKRIHGNVKNSDYLRGLYLHQYIHKYELNGGLRAFYQQFPDIQHTMRAIHMVEIDYRYKYYVRLYKQIGRHYELQIKHEQTKLTA